MKMVHILSLLKIQMELRLKLLSKTVKMVSHQALLLKITKMALTQLKLSMSMVKQQKQLSEMVNHLEFLLNVVKTQTVTMVHG